LLRRFAWVVVVSCFSIAGASMRRKPTIRFTVGVLIPGLEVGQGAGWSRLRRAETRETNTAEDRRQIRGERQVRRYGAGLDHARRQNMLVIGVGGQTEASVRKVAKRFPEKQNFGRGRQQGTQDANVFTT